MEKNRQKTESTQCQPEMQSPGASTQPTLNQHPLKEYSKYVTFNVMGMIGVSCYILADTFFVSKALGAQGLAALNLAFTACLYVVFVVLLQMVTPSGLII